MGAVAESSSSTGRDVEIVISVNANVPSKTELLLALDKMRDYIVTDTKTW